MLRPVIHLLALTLVTGACTSATTTSTVHPGLFIARLDEIPEDAALYSPTHRLFLIESPDDGLIALSDRDPHRGCRIGDVGPEDAFLSFVTNDAARFADPCHGSLYDASGRYLTGPSPRSMDRVPIEVIAGRVYVKANADIVQVPRPDAVTE